ncbi:MAG: ABC-type transport auxiliary lipoprotein family protein [Neisseria sp.]|uniref:PqiC family protein n=1 Tax=Neisseria sp. TaxID=192066 RepID=UPI0026DB6912|nr:ABC-type transport auxiliary lipoprotein family protein [Neisseria sp.]MDO4640116.1 ABC-type transport auxiliary lipoprotein family protein [Neisseria sp.]
MKKLLTATLTAVTLSACSTTAATQYYSLPDSQFELPQGQGKEIAVQIVLAEPLNNGGLVYQTDPLSLNFARNNLWASPLDQALAASFSNKLNRRQHSSYRYVPASRSGSSQVLKIYIEAFNGSYKGSTLVKGYAVRPNGHGKNFNIETPQQGDGYPAMIQSLDEGVESAAAALAD